MLSKNSKNEHHCLVPDFEQFSLSSLNDVIHRSWGGFLGGEDGGDKLYQVEKILFYLLTLNAVKLHKKLVFFIFLFLF